MRVRMKVDVSGSRDGTPWPKRGEDFEVSDGEGADLCASGLAVPVADSEKDVEKAVPADAEKRDGLTKESADAVTPGAPAAQEPDAAEKTEPAPAKKATAKRAATKPAESK